MPSNTCELFQVFAFPSIFSYKTVMADNRVNGVWNEIKIKK